MVRPVSGPLNARCLCASDRSLERGIVLEIHVPVAVQVAFIEAVLRRPRRRGSGQSMRSAQARAKIPNVRGPGCHFHAVEVDVAVERHRLVRLNGREVRVAVGYVAGR